MASIFPFIDPQEVVETVELPLASEWAWDYDKKEFKTKYGKMYQVERDDAIEIWLWKLFQTPRFRYLIYDWDYGHELEELVGVGFTSALVESEAIRYVKEAIEYNLGDYVTDIEDVDVTFEGTILTISFIAKTVYGEVEMNV